VPLTEFFFSGDLDYVAVSKDLLPKGRLPKEVADGLLAFGEALDAHRDFSAPGLEALAREFAEKNGWQTKELFMLLRLAASARKATPPLFETLVGLGRELTRRRLRLAAEYVKKMPAPAAAAPAPAKPKV
jgi:glutamyl-tRNA synthetase